MIVLTGGTGFLGSHLLRAFLADGRKVVLLKRSFSDTGRIADLMNRVMVLDLDRQEPDRVFATGHVTAVVHCATDYGRRALDPYQVIEANILLPLKLLHLAHKHRVARFINTDTVLDKRVNHYSLSKSQFVQWLRAYAASLVCVNVALEHFYGPEDDATKFVPFILRCLLRDEPEIALTPGEQKRYFVHMDDVVAAFQLILDHTTSVASGYYPFEVGSERAVSIRTFVELAKHLTGNDRTELRFGAIPYRENEVMDPAIDLSSLAALGWRPQVELGEGLARTIEFERRSVARCAT